MVSGIKEMASHKSLEVRIPPLELKENCQLECWRDFLLRFEIALINTSLALGITLADNVSKGETSTKEARENELDFRRGGMLLNSIGPDGYRIFTKWKIAAKDIKYTNLVERYEEQFTGRQNLFITRHKFLTMEQLSSESVESFIDRVAKSASFCRFDALEDDLTLQIITKGIRDDRLRKELLSTDKLDLTKAKNVCYLFASAEESSNMLTDKPSAEVAAVNRDPWNKGPSRKLDAKKRGGCFTCSSKDHWAKDCPKKKDMSCFKCGIKGHIAKWCKKRSVREVKASEDQIRYRDRRVLLTR